MDPINYFICTLGEAAPLNQANPSPFATIPALLEWQAKHNGHKAATGFPIAPSPGKDAWAAQIYTFAGLYEKVQDYAFALGRIVPNDTRIVALLATTGREYLFVWLGAVQLGCAVVLIAPEVNVAGMANLIHTTGATVLLHDVKYAEMAVKATNVLRGVNRLRHKTIQMPVCDDSVSFPRTRPFRDVDKADIAYIHHTSGTSSGMPSAIPITHSGAVGVLPVLDDTGATFTTTPLYHGGPADSFRAWTSSALIWLFPGIGDVPITGDNVLAAVDAVKKDNFGTKLSYFTAVPYVLELLAPRSDGCEMLRSMDLVGVGGAAMSTKLGDHLVREQSIHLVSRYGSAECGFILSSFRDIPFDTEWQYLRQYDSQYLRFEPQEGGVAELVLQNWPFMAKSNRGEGIYATADCFKPHLTKPNHWVYHSRNDSQLTLSTGKKFDPSSMEAAITDNLRPLESFREVYIFGNGKPYPGILVIRNENSTLKDPEVTDQVWPIVQTVNETSPPHAAIKKHMIVILPSKTPILQRASKGSLLRREIEDTFKNTLRDAYRRQVREAGDSQFIDLSQLNANVRRVINDVCLGSASTSMPDDEDLYKIGVDSVQCLEIRDQLQLIYGQVLDRHLSPTLVYDCGSIKNIIRHIYDIYVGAGMARPGALAQMEAMAAAYGPNYMPPGDFGQKRVESPDRTHQRRVNGEEQELPIIIVLTGVTGTLGVHILDKLRTSDQVAEVHCLVRGADQHAARERVRKALQQKQLPPPEQSKPEIHIHTCKLTDEQTLGLRPEVYEHLQQKAALIIHAAWQVNFNLPLKGFEDQLISLKNLLSLPLRSYRPATPSFLFCSSTASVLSHQSPRIIAEQVYSSPKVASNVGYAQSKWVAESVCRKFADSHKIPIAIARIGQLCGDEATGTWNVTEAWPLMLSSVRVTGALPDLKETLNWLKVDVAASAVLQISFDLLEESSSNRPSTDSLAVYHVINDNSAPKWTDMLTWIKRFKQDLLVLPPAEWVDRVENLAGPDRDHPARKLLGLWKTAYCGDESKEKARDVTFEMEKTLAVAPILKDVRPIDEAYFARVWEWIQREM